MRKLLLLGVMLLTLGLGGIGVSKYIFDPYLQQPMQAGGAAFYYYFSPGSNLRTVTRELSERGVLKHADYLLLHAKLNQKTRNLKSGIYYIEPDTQSPQALLAMLQKGGVAQFKLRTYEGETFSKMMQRVSNNSNLLKTLETNKPKEVMAAIGKKGQPYEGWFSPDTYHLPVGYSDVDFLNQAYRTQQKVLQQEWQQRAEGLTLKNAEEALILASIIEKETARDDERALVSAVFHNRLQKNMRLQTDPTVIYGMGEAFKGNLTRKDLRTKTPFNTYVIKGLPPTPISMPGRASIHAALHPAESKALFFVAKGDGSHHFSQTYKAHKAAVHQYQIVPYRKRLAARKAKREMERKAKQAEKKKKKTKENTGPKALQGKQ